MYYSVSRLIENPEVPFGDKLLQQYNAYERMKELSKRVSETQKEIKKQKKQLEDLENLNEMEKLTLYDIQVERLKDCAKDQEVKNANSCERIKELIFSFEDWEPDLDSLKSYKTEILEHLEEDYENYSVNYYQKELDSEDYKSVQSYHDKQIESQKQFLDYQRKYLKKHIKDRNERLELIEGILRTTKVSKDNKIFTIKEVREL